MKPGFRFHVVGWDEDKSDWWVCLRVSFDPETDKHFFLGANATNQLKTFHEENVVLDNDFLDAAWFASPATEEEAS
jgi:hypothetical protein